MPLYTSSIGKSWIIFPHGAEDVNFPLPVDHTYVYRNSRPQDYIECTGAKLKAVVPLMKGFAGKYAANVISSGSLDTVIVSMGTTTFGGLLDTLLFTWEADTKSEIELTLSDIFYRYHYVDSPIIRRGFYANESTGSPQISFEEAGVTPIELFAGDMWYNDGVFVVDSDGDTQYTAKLLMANVTESSHELSVLRFETNPPRQIVSTATSYVSTHGFITANSQSLSGSGWLVADWSGGLYMPDSQTVAVYGDKNYVVSSGGLYVSGAFQEYHWDSGSWDVDDVALFDGSGITFSTSSGGGTVESSSFALFAEYTSFASRRKIHAVFTASMAPMTIYQSVYTGTSTLTNGVYWVRIDAQDEEHSDEIYVGKLSWYGSNATSAGNDEVFLHRMGASPGSQSMYLRTRRRNGDTGVMEIAFNHDSNVSGTYAFTFVKVA